MTTDRFPPIPSQEELDSEQAQMDHYLHVKRHEANLINFRRFLIVVLAISTIAYLGAQ